MTWTEVITTSEGTGAVPAPCGGHTTCEYAGRLYIFGGGSGQHYVSELHVFDTVSSRWQLVRVAGTAPTPRSRHTAAFLGQRMFVLFGGDDTRVYDDVHVFDAEQNAWQEVATTGAHPGARWGHSMCVLPDRRLLVFGGHDGENMLNDLHILDTDTLVWTRLHTLDSTVPPPRAGHTASMVNRVMVVFGGGDGDSLLNDCWSLTLDGDDTPHWHRPVASGAPPSARCAHTSVSLPARSGSQNANDAQGPRVLVFGGGDGARRFKDVYVFDVHRLVDTSIMSAAATAAAPALPAANVAVEAIDPHHETLLRAQSGKARHSESIRRQTQGESDRANVTLRSFLERVGLPQFHDSFVAQDIDVSVLSSLTEAHLRELGVSTIGARLRIIAAAKELDGPPSASTNIVASAASTTNSPAPVAKSIAGSSASKRHTEIVGSFDHHVLLEAARALDNAMRLLSTSSASLNRALHIEPTPTVQTIPTPTQQQQQPTPTQQQQQQQPVQRHNGVNGGAQKTMPTKPQQHSPRKNGANRQHNQFLQQTD